MGVEKPLTAGATRQREGVLERDSLAKGTSRFRAVSKKRNDVR